MFHECTSLEALDLSSFDTSNVEKMRAMFNICSKLETIYVSEYFNTDNLVSWIDGSDNMFALDTKLVWWNGTKYDESIVDWTYAKIDTQSQSWYFTDFSKLNPKLFAEVQEWMNNYPRKILKGSTPELELQKHIGMNFKIPI